MGGQRARARTSRAWRTTASSTKRPSSSTADTGAGELPAAHAVDGPRSTSSAVGVKTSLATATWPGWMQARPTNPSRASSRGRRPEGVEVAEVGRHRRDRRLDAGGGGGQHDVRAGVEQLALVRAGGDPDVGAQVGLADLQPLHPRRPGELAGPQHRARALQQRHDGGLRPQRGQQLVEVDELVDGLGLGDARSRSAPGAGDRADVGLPQRTGVDPHPHADAVQHRQVVQPDADRLAGRGPSPSARPRPRGR